MSRLLKLLIHRPEFQALLFVLLFLFCLFKLPVFALVPICLVLLLYLLLSLAISKKKCFLILACLFTLLSFLNLLADPSIIYNSPPGDFQAYYTHSLDLNPALSSELSPVNSLWLTEPTIRIFYYLSSRFANENLYLFSLSIFLTFGYLYISFKLSPSKNHFLILSAFVLSAKVPFFAQGLWLVRQDISWLLFWMSVVSSGARYLSYSFFTFSIFSHNTILAMFLSVYLTKPFQLQVESLFRLKLRPIFLFKYKHFLLRLILIVLGGLLLLFVYNLLMARDSFQTNTLISVSPPYFVYIYSIIACAISFQLKSTGFYSSIVSTELTWALFISTVFGIF